MSKKPLSCQRCRTKKIRCDGEYPCLNCSKFNVDCVKSALDMRKKRFSSNYVENLQRKHSKLIGVLKQLESAKPEDRELLFKSIDLSEISDPDSESSQPLHKHINDDDDNDASVYGPTSIYDNELMKKTSTTAAEDAKEVNKFNMMPDILHCIQLFFVWQYPDLNMFIFREAFLQEFFKPKFYNIYCLKVLVLSICALGARMSDDDKIYMNSINYYNEARGLLLSKLNHPLIPSLQSYLLLAFYDIFNGSNSSGWMLSGNAIRMGFDLGFQLHPNSWFLKQKTSIYSKKIDNDIKSRIYWGAYLADHFISLILGRPSLLKLSDATIPETDDLPELENIDDYRYLDDQERAKPQKISNISDPLKKIINLINISENMLNDVFNKNFNEDINFYKNSSENSNLNQVLDKLNEYNEKIADWKVSLPPDLQFNQESLFKTGDNPTTSCIRYYYYILILCLNRPFIGLDDETFKKMNSKLIPRRLCREAIDDLYVSINKFKVVHGLNKSSILIVYCSILSISIMLLTNNSGDFIHNKNTKLKFFLIVLRETSRTWNIAKKSFISIASKLSNYEDIDFNLNDLHDEFPLEKQKSPTPVEVKPEPQDLETALLLPTHLNLNNFSTLSEIDNLDFFGGPPVLMTSDLFNQDWELLFPDYAFGDKHES